ncbi:S-adenosyl-L-methionine-dependent methyltransferase [Hesseltinella vesiculosa]|uniref:S-adenosyl-L-methionine-dependent methyltransferase n=1 Tax=Hesseltinella vesiculosa TaxID=101127 RepID=A0A1X2GYB7_9FUNG|nr:S-adenosyl-L-methionine-dependent methyltransferase [Hesseltinella vesiculosa]
MAIEKLESADVILEVGTNNGIWALEMANAYPNSKVIGMDPRSVSSLSSVPSNVEYVQTNLFQPWPMATNSVDLVFQRGLGAWVTKEQMQHLIKEAIRVVKPGGYIEWVEAEAGHQRPGPIQSAFDQFMEQEYQTKGMDFNHTQSFDTMILDLAQEQSIQLELEDHATYDIPLGEWPEDAQGKQLGFINQGIQKASYRNRKSYYAHIWSMSSQDYDVAMQALLDEFDEFKSYSRFHCWQAKKPVA